jgi:hypothetical protein
MTPTTASEKDPVRKKILAAMDRLIDGKPLRSTGRLSVSQLATEAGVPRWRLTHQHLDLKELFQARVKAAATDAGAPEPSGYEKLKADHAELRRHCTALEERLDLYASVINLLTLQQQADHGAGAVADIESVRRRRAQSDAADPS